MSTQPIPRIAAVLLAAGSSRRFGAANKLLARVAGEPLVRRVAERVLAARPDAVVVVTGHEAAEVECALAGLPIRFVHNPRHLDGIGGSVAAGIAALAQVDADNLRPKPVDGAFVCLGDMPDTEPELIGRLIAAFAASNSRSIIVPVAPDGRQGNPVLWPADLFAELSQLTGDAGAKRLIRAHPERVVEIATTGAAAFADIDTPGELAKYRTS